MSAAVLLATLCGQLPSPQLPLATASAPPPAQTAPGPPQTFVLLQYAPSAVPSAPSLLVASPPLWDRVLERTGKWLVARAQRHQHAQPMQAAAVAPAAVQLVPAQAQAQVQAQPPVQPAAVATPQAPAWAPPPPLVPSVLIAPQPQDDAIRRLFGGR